MIYIVMGTTGEYSDRTEWPVAALPTKGDAEKLVAALSQQYQQISQSMLMAHLSKEDEMKAIMSLDPNFSIDYTGTSYFVMEVPILTADELSAKLAA